MMPAMLRAAACGAHAGHTGTRIGAAWPRPLASMGSTASSPPACASQHAQAGPKAGSGITSSPPNAPSRAALLWL